MPSQLATSSPGNEEEFVDQPTQRDRDIDEYVKQASSPLSDPIKRTQLLCNVSEALCTHSTLNIPRECKWSAVKRIAVESTRAMTSRVAGRGVGEAADAEHRASR